MWVYYVCYFLYLLQMAMVCTFLGYGFEPRKKTVKKWRVGAGLFLCNIPLATAKFIVNDAAIMVTIILIITLVDYVIYIHVRLEGSLIRKIIYVLFAFIGSLLSEFAVQVALGNELLRAGTFSYSHPVMMWYLIYLTLISVMIYIVFFQIWHKINAQTWFGSKMLFFYMIVPVSQMIMLWSTNKDTLAYNVEKGLTTTLGVVISILADVFLLYALMKKQRSSDAEVRLEEVKSVWEMEQNHYQNIENHREELAKIRHDLSEHFLVMKNLMDTGKYDKAKDMLNILQEDVSATKECIYCGDPVINALMAECEKQCREKGIKLDYDLQIIQPLKINPVAISSILSNLTRNAIKELARNDDEKILIVKIGVMGDYLNIRVDNTYLEHKIDANRKCYGLEIVKSLAEKYHGYFDVIKNDNVFSARVSVENIEESEPELL